jgi:hypothetical protein
MPETIYRTYRPRLGIQQPLRERWETTRTRLAHTLPEDHPQRASLLGLPCDEYTIDHLEDAIAQHEALRAAAVEQPGEALKAAFDEIMNLKRRYATAHRELLELQKRVRLIANDVAHQILRDVPHNAFDNFPPVSLSGDDHPRYSYSSLSAARKAAGDWLAPTMFIEGLVRQLRAVIHFHSLPDGERALMLINSLHDRIEQLEAKLNKKAKVAA